MKRCNVCGNIGDDECTVCSICGNPLTEADVITDQEGESVPGQAVEPEPDLMVTSEEVGPAADDWRTEGAGLPGQGTVLTDQTVETPIRDAAVSAQGAVLSAQDAGTPIRDAAISAQRAAVSAKAAAESARAAAASAMKAEASAKVVASMPEAAPMPEAASPNAAVTSAEKSGADKRESFVLNDGSEFVPLQSYGMESSGQSAGAMNSSRRPEGAVSSTQQSGETASFVQQSEETIASAQQPGGTASSANQPVRVRRSRSGPQIYGQDSMAGYSGAQGVIRRDVQGGHLSDGTQSVSGAASSVNRTAVDAGTSRRAVRGDNASTQSRSAETGKVRSFRSESAAVMRQGRSANGQLNTPGGAANAQPGAPVNRPMQGQPQAQRPGVPPYAQVAQGDRQQAIKITTARKVMEIARDALASPMMILIALFYMVYFVSNIAAIFLRQLNFSQIARLLTMFSFPSQLSGYISMFQAAMSWLDKGALALNLLIRVPELLFCIGLWLLIVLVRTADEQMSGAGFLFMRISVILTMIAACGILLVVLVVSVTLVIAAWSAGTQSVIVVAAVTLAATIAVTMAVLMYYFCYLATLKTVRRSAGNGEQYGKASAYVAVIHIIIAFTGIINILSGIVNLEITGITGGAGQICWMVLFGIWILRYRSSMNEYAE
ncbi:MAG: hypothetical protein LUG99_12765 [Lachnospiraceae bacterium]|nr:hypothetical protein [Lachnospiraceae bacterium]